MTSYTFMIDDCLRIAVDAPAQGLTGYAPGTDADDYIPIVVVGDSSKPIPWQSIETILTSNFVCGDFIVDLLLVNGPYNRYMYVQVDGLDRRWSVESLSDKGGVSPKVHERATKYLQQLSKNICSMHVLSDVLREAVANGTRIPQRIVISE